MATEWRQSSFNVANVVNQTKWLTNPTIHPINHPLLHLLLTCTSSSVKPTTGRAFITTFQLFLSLMELSLGQFPCTQKINITPRLMAQVHRKVIHQQHHQHYTYLDQIEIFLRVSFQVQCVEQVIVRSIQELIEDVEVPLTLVLVHHSWFLQQVVQDVTAHRCPLGKISKQDGCPRVWGVISAVYTNMIPLKVRKSKRGCLP